MHTTIMQPADNDERFMSLETKIAYQEKLLQELSDVLRQQGQELDRIALRLARLQATLELGGEPSASLPHERPPHY